MIRKIIFGPDPKNGMNYIVGQQWGSFVIHHIREVEHGHIKVFAINDKNEVSVWKESVGVPYVKEYDQDGFDG